MNEAAEEDVTARVYGVTPPPALHAVGTWSIEACFRVQNGVLEINNTVWNGVVDIRYPNPYCAFALKPPAVLQNLFASAHPDCHN